MAIKRILEKDIQKLCLQYLTNVLGWVAWRNNSGAVTGTYKGKKRFVRFNSAVGSSDIFFIAPGGVFGCVEVKREGKQPTVSQDAWLTSVRSAGGIALCVHSLMELESALASLGYVSQHGKMKGLEG